MYTLCLMKEGNDGRYVTHQCAKNQSSQMLQK
jgi:hypothetical protein